MTHSSGAATKPILPVAIPNTPYQWARGIRAGRWVFATGQCGTDYVHALAPEVLQSGHPFDRHYNDQIDLWRTGQTVPLPFTSVAIAAAAVSSLTLTP